MKELVSKFITGLLTLIGITLLSAPIAAQTSSLTYNFEIPDTTRPIPKAKRGVVGPAYELIPFQPSPVSSDKVLGKNITEISLNVGTYGMGGPGFFGINLEGEWLIISIWGASGWITVDDRLISNMSYTWPFGKKPWITPSSDNLSELIIGETIIKFEVNQHSLRIVLSNGMALSIEESADNRPIFAGSKEPREFLETDDLRRAVFLSPTSEIWI